MLHKVGSLNADAYIIDLEDSISENEKDSALNLLKSFLDANIYIGVSIIIRLNKEGYHRELLELS